MPVASTALFHEKMEIQSKAVHIVACLSRNRKFSNLWKRNITFSILAEAAPFLIGEVPQLYEIYKTLKNKQTDALESQVLNLTKEGKRYVVF